jgi:drug/metabolite transporter (DMT)-like permease
VLFAFGIIYFVWGSTFLAIRVGVREVPPFLLAGIRFLVAGGVLYGWMRLKRTPTPTGQEWRSATLLAVMIFVFDYGLLFWAEQRVPSGIAAVMMATIPVFMAISEILIIKGRRLTGRLVIASVLGLGGVVVLVNPSVRFGDSAVSPIGAIALLFASASWSVASAISRKVPLPAAKAMSSGAQMLAGGVLLTITAGLLGEFHGFHVHAVSTKAWLCLAYLIVAGSIIGFTAYVWLLHHESPTKVGTYAYVNPVVAVLVGYFFGGEAIGPRTIAGTLLVLVGIIVITTAPAKKKETNDRFTVRETSVELE